MTKNFQILTTDLAKANVYTLRLITNYIGYTNSAVLDFEVTLVDTCATTVLSIDSTMLSSLSIKYNIGDNSHVETLDDSKVTAFPSVIGCPDLEYTFRAQDNGPIDGTVFSYSGALTKEFTTYSVDSVVADIYPLRLIVNFIGYTNSAVLDF